MERLFLPRILVSFISLSLAGATFTLPTASLFAQSDSQPKKKKKKKKKKKSSDSELPPDATEIPPADSAGKNFKNKYILGNAGLSPQPFIGFGGTLGYLLKEDFGIEALLTYSSGKIDPVAVTVLNVTARARKSFFSIPYVAGGLGFRTASAKWYTYSADGTTDLDSGASTNAITLEMATGASFKLGSFVLGADLVGVSFPLFKMGAKTTTPTDDYNQADFEEQKAKFDKVGSKMTLTLAKVGVGFAF